MLQSTSISVVVHRLALRSLRQISVVERVRGQVIQQGGLAACNEWIARHIHDNATSAQVRMPLVCNSTRNAF